MAKATGDAGAVRGNRGAVAGSRRPARVSTKAQRAFRASRPGGCLPAPAFGVFQVARTHRLGARARRGSASCRGCSRQRRHVGPEEVTGRDRRNSCERTSRTVSRQRQASGPGAGRSHVRCWIQTPRRRPRRTIIGTPCAGGDKCGWVSAVAPAHQQQQMKMVRRPRLYGPAPDIRSEAARDGQWPEPPTLESWVARMKHILEQVEPFTRRRCGPCHCRRN